MSNALSKNSVPDWVTTPLLTQSEGWPDMSQRHRAEIAIIAESVLGDYFKVAPSEAVMLETVRRWMDNLQDYTIPEIRAAFDRHVLQSPNKKPNFGHIRKIIINARLASGLIAKQSKPKVENGERVTAERAAQIMKDAGIMNLSPNLKKFGEGV